MTQPVPPPPLDLQRSEQRREDGRYLIYYTFTPFAAEPEADLPAGASAKGGENAPCQS
jgi:hypothetical protein